MSIGTFPAHGDSRAPAPADLFQEWSPGPTSLTACVVNNNMEEMAVCLDAC
jgi:hypothetical protein